MGIGQGDIQERGFLALTQSKSPPLVPLFLLEKKKYISTLIVFRREFPRRDVLTRTIQLQLFDSLIPANEMAEGGRPVLATIFMLVSSCPNHSLSHSLSIVQPCYLFFSFQSNIPTFMQSYDAGPIYLGANEYDDQ